MLVADDILALVITKIDTYNIIILCQIVPVEIDTFQRLEGTTLLVGEAVCDGEHDGFGDEGAATGMGYVEQAYGD